MPVLGILCGLDSEAKIAGKISGAKIACAAAVPQKARSLARGLVEQGATRLMSFGVCGALDVNLPVGALVIGNKVMSKESQWLCDAAWADDVMKRLSNAQRGDVWGSEFLVPTASEKIGLHQTTGCTIVDMESQCAAEIAASANLPLAVVRVVCDEASHNVPSLVMKAINPDGSTNYLTVMTSLMKAPMQTFDLIKVGRSMARAMRVLNQTASKLIT